MASNPNGPATVPVKLDLPAHMYESLRQEAISSGRSMAEVLRRTLATGQYVEGIVGSPDKELLIEENGKVTSKFKFAR